MKVLITGAGGFVGPHLIRELKGTGHDVFATDMRPGAYQSMPVDASSIVNLSRPDEVEQLFKECTPDAVVHLAGWSHVGASWKSPMDVFNANLMNTVRLYEIAGRVRRPPKRLLFVSSADVFGIPEEGELPFDENSTVRPSSPYAVSKYATELALRSLSRISPVSLVIVRPFNHIGPGQAPAFVCPAFARQIAEIEKGQRDVLLHGNLASKRDFLDVRDVTRAYRLIMEHDQPEDLYVIASGIAHSIDWVVRQLFAAAGIEPKMQEDPERMRPSDTPELRGSAALLTEHTGWKPSVDLADTFQDLIREARASLQSTAS